MRCAAIGIVLVMVATAHADPAIANLASALPAGWQLTTPKGELVIQRTEAVRVAGHHLANPHVGNLPVATAPTAPTITLALRYRLDPRWSQQRIADVQAANRKVYAALAALRARHRIDEIRTSKGLPLPATPDEQQRLTAYDAERARMLAQVQPLPRCTLGESSLLDTPRTYAQLDLMVDPPGAMREAYAIVELVKRRCR